MKKGVGSAIKGILTHGTKGVKEPEASLGTGDPCDCPGICVRSAFISGHFLVSDCGTKPIAKNSIDFERCSNNGFGHIVEHQGQATIGA